MSVDVYSAVMRCGPIFKGAEKVTLLALADSSNVDGFCWPSIRDIAWRASINERSVKRALDDLIDLSVIRKVQGGGRKSNRYFIQVEWLADIAHVMDRTKKKAIQDGADRFQCMTEVAEAQRADMETVMHQDPDFGPRWRKRHNKPGTVFNVTPDTESGVTQSQGCEGVGKSTDVAHVTAGVTLGPLEVTQSHPSDDTGPPEPLIETFNKPSKETSATEGCLQEPKEQSVLQRSRLGEEEDVDEQAASPPVPCSVESSYSVQHTPAEYRIQNPVGAFERTQKLATALGMREHQICMALGSLTRAEDLARRWQVGELTIDDVQLELSSEGEDEVLELQS